VTFHPIRGLQKIPHGHFPGLAVYGAHLKKRVVPGANEWRLRYRCSHLPAVAIPPIEPPWTAIE
jgi:hypothetical protein